MLNVKVKKATFFLLFSGVEVEVLFVLCLKKHPQTVWYSSFRLTSHTSPE